MLMSLMRIDIIEYLDNIKMSMRMPSYGKLVAKDSEACGAEN